MPNESIWLARIPEENPDPIIRVSTDFVILYGNPAAEVLYRLWGSSVGRRVPAPVQEIVAAALAHKTVLRHELIWDSRTLWLTITPFPEEGYATIYVKDMTEQKRAQEALQESEARLRAVMEVLPVGVFLADAGGRIVSANRAAADIWGGTVPLPQNVEQYGLYKGWWAGTGRWVEPHEWGLARAVRNGQTCGPEEVEIQRFDGTHKTILSYATAVRDGEGQIAGAVAVNVDITARRQAENVLRQSEERFRRAVEKAAGAVAIATLDAGISYANPAFLKLVGYEEKDLQNSVLRWDRISPPEYATADARAIEQLRETGVARPYEKEYVARDGRRVPVLISSSVTGYGPEGEPQVVVFITDLRPLKRMEAELRRLNDQLEEEVQAQTEELRDSVRRLHEEVARRMQAETEQEKAFIELQERARQLQQLTLELSQAEDRERQHLAEILHDDLQQLLAAAKFHLGLLLRDIEHDDRTPELGATVQDLLRQAIDKSRGLSHELSPPALTRGDLYDAFEWLTQQMQIKHGLTVHLEAFDRIEVGSKPLKAMLFKATQELLFNVIKHAGVKEAQLRLRRNNGRIYVSIADRGQGFDLRAVRKVGLGLLTIRERVELLGGRMKIKSTPGKGSIFALVVPDPDEPQAETDKAGTKAGHSAVSPSDVPTYASSHVPLSSPLRVLLVDDHKIVRQGIEAMLGEEQDIEVVGEAGNGREAVDLADRLRPDVVVMDVAMPVMGGDEATQEIKQHRPQTRVVALSMFDDVRVADRMRQAGAAAYLLKTAPTEELLAAIRGREPAAQEP